MYERLTRVLNHMRSRLYWKVLRQEDRRELKRVLDESRKEYRHMWRVYVHRKNGRLVVASYEEFLPRERILNRLQERILRITKGDKHVV